VSRDGLLGAVERRLARQVLRRRLWMRNPRPLVSFTFDDVPASACETGRSILEHHGVRATYFASGGLSVEAGRASGLFAAAHLVALHAAGHEIGSHGYAHRPYQSLDSDAIEQDMRANDDYLRRVFGADFRAVSFSFPFGSTGLTSKRAVARRFQTARGVQSGVNRRQADASLLLGTPLYEHRMADPLITRMLDEAWQRNGWLIFYTHDVESVPSSVGCSPASFSRLVEQVVRRGFEVLPVKDAYAVAAGEARSSNPREMSP